MHLKSLSLGAIVFLMALGVAMITHGQQPPSTVYNPYPPGILPTDLNSELARVLREVNFIESVVR